MTKNVFTAERLVIKQNDRNQVDQFIELGLVDFKAWIVFVEYPTRRAVYRPPSRVCFLALWGIVVGSLQIS